MEERGGAAGGGCKRQKQRDGKRTNTKGQVVKDGRREERVEKSQRKEHCPCPFTCSSIVCTIQHLPSTPRRLVLSSGPQEKKPDPHGSPGAVTARVTHFHQQHRGSMWKAQEAPVMVPAEKDMDQGCINLLQPKPKGKGTRKQADDRSQGRD